MPEHPSDDYLLVNSGIKISRVNCELGAEGFWKRSSGNTDEDRKGWVGRGGKEEWERERKRKKKRKEKNRHKEAHTEEEEEEEAFDQGSLLFTLGSIAAWLWWLLQYRRGGNRPITCRLLICSTQTAAVLPPMRKTCVDPLFSLLECISTPLDRSRISIPLGLMLRYSIVPLAPPLLSFPCALIRSLFSFANYFDPSPLPPFTSSSCCNYPLPLPDKTFLNWVSFGKNRPSDFVSQGIRLLLPVLPHLYVASVVQSSSASFTSEDLFISSDSSWGYFWSFHSVQK